MKKFLSYSLLAAAATGMSFADTATTNPVGYVTLDVPASSDTNVGQAVHRPIAFQGAASSVSGSVITVSSNSGLTVNQFVYAPPAQTNSYYLQVIGGALNGQYFDVVSNTATQITIDNGSTNISSIVNFKIIPFWTLNTLFPAGQGVGTTSDIFDPVGLVQFKNPAAIGVNKAAAKSYFHYTGTDEAGTGWYDNDNLSLGLQNDLTIDPSLGARVRNLQAVAKQVVVAGVVPATPVATPIVKGATPNDNFLSVQVPLDMTLAQSGLSSALTAATDIFDPVDLVQIYNDTAPGVNKPVVKTYFYYVGSEEQGTGWYDNDNLSLGKQDNVPGILKAGRVFNVRRPGGTPTVSQAVLTLPYSL